MVVALKVTVVLIQPMVPPMAFTIGGVVLPAITMVSALEQLTPPELMVVVKEYVPGAVTTRVFPFPAMVLFERLRQSLVPFEVAELSVIEVVTQESVPPPKISAIGSNTLIAKLIKLSQP